MRTHLHARAKIFLLQWPFFWLSQITGKREDDDIYTTAIIPLPFQVQKTIVMMQKMGHKDVARVVLRAVEYNDYKAPAKSELVMID